MSATWHEVKERAGLRPGSALDDAVRIYAPAYASQDAAQEEMRAFAEKRKPRWQGDLGIKAD